MMKRHLLCACAAPALMIAIAAPASAQDTPPPATTTDDSGKGDIVVTAQGRAQVLADVPVAISAITAESLERSGTTDIRQLNQLAPSLLVSSTGSESNGSARIRGIGTVGDNPGLESSVALFIDGVYRSRTGVGLNELGDIERVEVLRGPQGTLGGRNSTAGLISIISKAPSFSFSGGGEITYGNYDYWRFAGNLNVPLGETVAARVDGVYVKRDGFLKDVVSGGRVNDRDRYFVRGQILFEPSSTVSLRLIGDYSRRDESCCAAAYKATRAVTDPTPGSPGDFAILPANPIVGLVTAFGGLFPDPGDPYSRNVAITAGRSYRNTTTDWGMSGQLDWDLGGASLTWITAYREYKAGAAADLDYSNLDLIYRADDGRAFRQFKTFTQEVRFQGTAFDDRLDWLVGGYYANEKLTLRDNLQFGNQYGPYNACTLVTGAGLTAFRSIGTTGCLTPTGRGAVLASFPGLNATGTDGAALLSALDQLYAIRNVGDQGSSYEQESKNYAFFTHNIFKVTDTVSLTIGVRYTNESKSLDVATVNNNTGCAGLRASILPALGTSASATARTLLGNAIVLGCLFNSNSSLTGLPLSDERNEDEFTGTAILSWKPTPDLLTYASFSRGYKAGGFNLDRSALGSPIGTITSASVAALQFDSEKVNAFEIGAKYSTRKFGLSVAAFRQEFKSFQLNTFNGLFFLVQNINGCGTDLGATDSDLSAATGACAPDEVEAGLVSQGVEVEASITPSRFLAVTLGFTYTDAKFKKDLVGRDTGVPLDPALFRLPDNNLSNAPKVVGTASVAWTPELGSSGLSALFYVDGRMTSDYNTGSDIFIEKAQDGYALVNARIGLRGTDMRWSIELWAQNLFDKGYDQIAFNSPLQGSSSQGQVQDFGGTSTRIYSAFIAEPRTYGITLRSKF